MRMRSIMTELAEEMATIIQKVQFLLQQQPGLKTAHPNDILIAYWRMYDQFGDVALIPHNLSNYHSIDRAIRRVMPAIYKNYKREKEYREWFGHKS